MGILQMVEKSFGSGSISVSSLYVFLKTQNGETTQQYSTYTEVYIKMGGGEKEGGDGGGDILADQDYS